MCKTTTKFLSYGFDNWTLTKKQHRQLKALGVYLKGHCWNCSGTVGCTDLIGNGKGQ